MKICPKCHDEFRDEIVSCSMCQVPLLMESEMSGKPKKLAAHEMLSLTSAKRFVEGPLETCREVEKVLMSHEIPAILEPIQEVQKEVIGAATIKRYALLIAEDHFAKAAEALHNRFAAQIEREGFGQFSDATVLLDASEITCPACGFVGALQNGSCAECELFLGEPG